MIIKFIENRNGFWIFSKDKVTVVTDEGEGSVSGQLLESIIKDLNEKLKDFNIASKEDFVRLKEICKDNYKVIEECLINSSRKFWFSLNSNANMIPRPMSLILKKDSGIRAFYTLSLDCGDFHQASMINQRIFEMIEAKLNKEGFKMGDGGFYHGLDDKKVFDILRETLKEVSQGITFNIRICVNLKNSKGENNRENMIEYITGLVFNDNALIAINPLNLSELNNYEKLKSKVIGDCYIAVDHIENFDDKKADFIYLKQDDLVHVAKVAKAAKEKNLNVIFDGSADVCVGFGFPILKIDLTAKKADNKFARVSQILEEIKEYRAGLKKENGVENLGVQ